MPRVEIALRTALQFHSHPPDFAPPASELGKTHTVTIPFDGRTYVWHVFDPSPASPPFPEWRWAPTVTVVHDNDADRPEAAANVARLLSALAFHYDLILDADASFYGGGSGESDPFRPPMARAHDQFPSGKMTMPAPACVEVVDDKRLRLALAVYREAVNALSPYLGFFAYWGVLDAVFGPKPDDVDAFVNSEADKEGGIEDYAKRVHANWQPPEEAVAAYLREHSRNAIGHVIRDRDDRPHINPDDPAARVRLGAEAHWVRAIARRAILTTWPNAVTVLPRVI